jgi:hypothetical protein
METNLERAAGLFVALVLLMTMSFGCGSTGTGHRYKLYPGPERPEAKLAALGFAGKVVSFEVDGMRVYRADFEFVELTPGQHTIAWHSSFGTDVLERVVREELAATMTVELLAGHNFVLTDKCPSTFLCIKDTTTGEFVSGSDKS